MEKRNNNALMWLLVILVGVLVIAVIILAFMVVNLLTDLAYGFVDPRIRYA